MNEVLATFHRRLDEVDMVTPSETYQRDGRMMPILSTMVYCLKGDQVLLMLRHKEPNLDLWVAPGGKVEPGESPYECALRELREETGLQAEELLFRGLVTEVSPRPDWQWMLFLYVVTEFSGQLTADEREGAYHWWSLTKACQLPIPQADKVFFTRVIDLSQPFYHGKYVYDADLRLVEVIEHPTRDRPSHSTDVK